MVKQMIVAVIQGNITTSELVGASLKKRVSSTRLDLSSGVWTVNYNDGTIVKIIDDPGNEPRRATIRRKRS